MCEKCNEIKEDKLFSLDLEKCIIYMDGTIEEEDARIFDALVDTLIMEYEEEGMPKLEKITIDINSQGGSVDSGLQIVARIEELKCDGYIVETICKGICASMASLILCSGSKGYKKIRKYSKVLIHPSLVLMPEGSVMDIDDIKYHLNRNKQTWKTFEGIYLENTKITKAELNRIYKNCEDREYTYQEAIDKGIVDSLL